ncbi:MAG: 50S ribosomal protein L3 [Deltaproteobacteria bacterium]
MVGLIGKKMGMTQVFREDGELVPVTVIETGPCTVVDIRRTENDGYDALQLGTGKRRPKRIGRALAGHMQKAGRADFAELAEVRVKETGDYEVGQQIVVADVFTVGDLVDVTGTTKGRGFAGVMKRYNFKGQSATHGTHESFRGPGSIGACAYPGRVFKGKRMPGHMGAVRRTTQNLEIVAVRSEDNVVLVRGGVPGPRGGRLLIRPAVKGNG